MSDVTLLVRSLMTESEVAPWVTPEELSYVATFGNDERRREFLSWRAVVRQALGREVQIAYNELGAPILVGRAEHISVSHTRDLLVVALSKDRVGVDIERLDRGYQRILAKYLILAFRLRPGVPRRRSISGPVLRDYASTRWRFVVLRRIASRLGFGEVNRWS